MTTYDKILAELQKSTELANAATKGPWRHCAVKGGWDGVESASGETICELVANVPVNATFIASARTDLPKRDAALRVAVEALRHITTHASDPEPVLSRILSILTPEPK